MPEVSKGEWSWSDAWILAAVALNPAGAGLADLIGTADGINHAIPTRDELSRGLGALIAANLVELIDGRFFTTAAGNVVRTKWRGGLFDWGEALLPKLQCLPRPAEEFALTELDMDSAYRAYRNGLR